MSEMPRLETGILLIDVDRKFCELMSNYLRLHAFDIQCAHSGRSGLDALRAGGFALVLLDIFLPDINGIEVLRRLRAECETPVVILSAHNEEADRIATLEMGADDYVPKTFSSRELLARIRAVLRRRAATGGGERRPSSGQDILRVRGLELRDSTKEVFLDGEPVNLTTAEFQLLFTMAAEPGRIFTREHLMVCSVERDYDKSDRSIDVRIASLRHKLGDSSHTPRYIRTWRGLGYSVIK